MYGPVFTLSGVTLIQPTLQRWICIRMETLGGVFSAALAAYLVYVRTSVDASNTGFSLNMAVAFSSNILWVSLGTT